MGCGINFSDHPCKYSFYLPKLASQLVHILYNQLSYYFVCTEVTQSAYKKQMVDIFSGLYKVRIHSITAHFHVGVVLETVSIKIPKTPYLCYASYIQHKFTHGCFHIWRSRVLHVEQWKTK